MRVSKQVKEQRHQLIIDQTAEQIRANGIDQTSVGSVMKAANLTHGGFYRHFESKEELVDTALERAFSQLLSPYIGDDPNQPDNFALDEFINSYLSDTHIEQPEKGCPLTSVGQETSRPSQTHQQQMTNGIDRLLEQITSSLNQPTATNHTDEDAALAMLSSMVGAVVLARLFDDPDRRESTINATKNLIQDHLHNGGN